VLGSICSFRYNSVGCPVFGACMLIIDISS
jgi:hypothetical protein